MEPVAEIELDDHQQAIARYYRECWLDYRFFWINRKNLGMHFGYWDETTRTHASIVLVSRCVISQTSRFGSSVLSHSTGGRTSPTCVPSAMRRMKPGRMIRSRFSRITSKRNRFTCDGFAAHVTSA